MFSRSCRLAARFQSRPDDQMVLCGPAAENRVAEVVLGDEGQRWMLMSDADFINHPKAVPAFQERLRVFLGEMEGCKERPPASLAGGGDEHQEEPVRRGVSPRVKLSM